MSVNVNFILEKERLQEISQRVLFCILLQCYFTFGQNEVFKNLPVIEWQDMAGRRGINSSPF